MSYEFIVKVKIIVKVKVKVPVFIMKFFDKKYLKKL